jgi:hypothetical protein
MEKPSITKKNSRTVGSSSYPVKKALFVGLWFHEFLTELASKKTKKSKNLQKNGKIAKFLRVFGLFGFKNISEQEHKVKLG